MYDPEQVELTLFLGSKTENEPINEPINADIFSIYDLIKAEPTISKAKIAQRLKISLSTVKRRIDELEEKGQVKHSGPNKGGHWEILNLE